jgi:hypothetical protein
MATEKDIQNSIFQKLYDRKKDGQNMFFDITSNIKFFDWESDLLFKNQQGSIYEIEIKTSLSDYLKDFENKKKKHKELSVNRNNVPAYFYFLVPTEIVDKIEVPEYCGLYAYTEYQCRERGIVIDTYIIKEAPKLTNITASYTDTIKMLRSTAFKYWRSRTGGITKTRK